MIEDDACFGQVLAHSFGKRRTHVHGDQFDLLGHAPMSAQFLDEAPRACLLGLPRS